MRALRSSPGAGGSSGGLGLVDEHELRVASGEPHLDVPVGELVVERERRLGEQVDQPQPERRLDRVRQAPRAARRRPRRRARRRRRRDRAGSRRCESPCVEYDIKMMSVKCVTDVSRRQHDVHLRERPVAAPGTRLGFDYCSVRRAERARRTLSPDTSTSSARSRRGRSSSARAARRPTRPDTLADDPAPLPALAGTVAARRDRALVRARVHGALAPDPDPRPADDRRRDRRRRPLAARAVPRRDRAWSPWSASASTSRAATRPRGSASRSRRGCARCCTPRTSASRARSTTVTRRAR